MRIRHLILLALVLAVAGGTGASTASASGAQTITVVARQVDVNPGETNPCDGDVGTITDDEQDGFHVTAHASGALELSGHGTARVTFVPDGGGVSYTGQETFNIAEAGSGPTFTTTMTTHLRLHGTYGSFITIREVAHLTVSTGDVRVAFDRPTFSCS